MRPEPDVFAERSYASLPAEAFRLSVLVPVFNERHVVEASLLRVLALRDDLIRELEVIVVDDHSNDGTSEVLDRIAEREPRIVLIRHEQQRGKGAAIRTALERASGDICVVHDADLEYNPADFPALLVPFAKEGADAVYGSRYLSAPYRRALRHRHTVMNRALTSLSNWMTDLNLTDLETCYKAINTTLLKSMPLRCDDFRFEVEVTFKLAKRHARVFEVPIRYFPRSWAEGKKIKPRDALLALAAMCRFALIDDLYKDDEYGSQILAQLEHARRYKLWLASTLRPYIGDRVLEVGAGIGTLTNEFIPRALYVASDVNPHYLNYLRSYAAGKPYLYVLRLDLTEPAGFAGLENQFDTIVMVNVLEHVADERLALRNLHGTLRPGGRLVILVPAHPSLFGTLDEALDHCRRYTPATLRQSVEQTGFRVERLFDFNRVSMPGWWLNGQVLRRRRFSRVQLKALDSLMPVLRRIDRFWPWSGLSLITVAVK